MNHLIDKAKLQKSIGQGSSFFEIEKHKRKVDKMSKLPSIEQIKLFEDGYPIGDKLNLMSSDMKILQPDSLNNIYTFNKSRSE